MGEQDPHVTNLKTLVIGCTPLARKVTNLLKEISNLVGVVNLHPDKGLSKSNYDPLTDICEPFLTKDINNKETKEWIRSRNPEVSLTSLRYRQDTVSESIHLLCQKVAVLQSLIGRLSKAMASL